MSSANLNHLLLRMKGRGYTLKPNKQTNKQKKPKKPRYELFRIAMESTLIVGAS